MADRLDELRKDLHAVEITVAVVKTELGEHRAQSREQHDATMAALAATNRAIDQLRADLSDQGRTPGPPPSLPPGPMPALPTLAPEPPRERGPRDSSSDPGEIRISPRRLAPWLAAWFPLVRALWPVLASAALTGGGVEACHQLELREPDPTEAAP